MKFRDSAIPRFRDRIDPTIPIRPYFTFGRAPIPAFILFHLAFPRLARRMIASDPDRQIQAIERPNPSLLTYYLLSALVIPPLFPILALVLYFRYHTMRYAFTDDGISMSWGILFRRQIIVNYARIQDIHLKSNFVERWLGLARILVQTASGSASAEMTIEGIKEFEPLRDFLYARMRGVKDHHPPATGTAAPSSPGIASPDEVTAALREAVAELRAIRQALETPKTPGNSRHV